MDSTSHGENTYVADTKSAAEIVRLINQDRAATQVMGGPLAGLPAALRKLLSRAGYTDIHTAWFGADSSADTEGWADFYHNYEIGLLQLKPLLITLDLTKPEEFEKLYEQALLEMRDPDFTCMTDAFTVWGNSPQ